MLARVYSYKRAFVDEAPVSSAAGKITGIGNKRRIVLAGVNCDYSSGDICPQYNPKNYATGLVEFKDSKSIIINYIRNGSQLSQILCRNYLAGLSDKNSAFSALRKQFNITGGLAELTMVAAKASARSIGYFGAAESFVNATLENFGEYEYLTPDQSTLQDLVYKSQNALDAYYTGTNVPTTIAGAVNAVHRIDSQCTRAGLRHLINRSLSNITMTPEADGTLTVKGADTLKQYDQEYSTDAIRAATIELNIWEAARRRLLEKIARMSPPDEASLTKLNDIEQKIDEANKKLLNAQRQAAK